MQNKKWNSRKFIVWVVATFFVIAAFVISFIQKETTVLTQIIGWWGGISTAYIGGNVAQDLIFNSRKE